MAPNPLTPDQDRAVRGELADGRPIQAIKMYRAFTGAGLADAKNAVEAMTVDGRAGPPTGRAARDPAGAASAAGDFAPDDWWPEATRLAVTGRKIQAIKLIRESTGIGLKAAVDVAEAMRAGTAVRPAATITRGLFDESAAAAVGLSLPDAVRQEVERLLLDGKKIDAVRAVRDATGLELKESKEAAEAVEAELRRDHPQRFHTAGLRKAGGCFGTVLLLLGLSAMAVAAVTRAPAAGGTGPAAARPPALLGMKAGLPMSQAQAKAADIERQIDAVIAER